MGKRFLLRYDTEKSRGELKMLVELGMRMIDSKLSGTDGSKEFVDYGTLGYPEVMGFPSSYSDTGWMYRREHGDPLAYILSQIRERGERGEHMPLMLHDWVAWNQAPDRELTHVKRIVECARKQGYEPITHAESYRMKPLWHRS